MSDESNEARKVKMAIITIGIVVMIELIMFAVFTLKGGFDLTVGQMVLLFFRDLVWPLVLTLLISAGVFNAVRSYGWAPSKPKQAFSIIFSQVLAMLFIWHVVGAFGRGFARGFFGG